MRKTAKPHAPCRPPRTLLAAAPLRAGSEARAAGRASQGGRQTRGRSCGVSKQKPTLLVSSLLLRKFKQSTGFIQGMASVSLTACCSSFHQCRSETSQSAQSKREVKRHASHFHCKQASGAPLGCQVVHGSGAQRQSHALVGHASDEPAGGRDSAGLMVSGQLYCTYKERMLCTERCMAVPPCRAMMDNSAGRIRHNHFQLSDSFFSVGKSRTQHIHREREMNCSG